MTTIPRAKQQALLAELKERDQIARFIKERSRVVLAMEYDCQIGTIMRIANTGYARFLEPEDVAQILKSERERKEAERKLEEFKPEAIADRVGVSKHTIRRYRERYFHEQAPLPICTEDFRGTV